MYFVEEKSLWKILHRLVHSLFHAFLFLLSVFKKGFFFSFSRGHLITKKERNTTERGEKLVFSFSEELLERIGNPLFTVTHTHPHDGLSHYRKWLGRFYSIFIFVKRHDVVVAILLIMTNLVSFFFLKNDGNKWNKHEKQIPPGSASSGLKILSIRLLKNIKIKNTA